MKKNTARQALKDGNATVGTWLSLACPMAARFLVRTGFDWLTVDCEHSPADWETAATILGCVSDVGGIPLVRVPAGRHDHIKRALDSGAYGVVVPMVMTRQEAECCVSACKYEPVGDRSVGGSLHALNFGATPEEYYKKAHDELLIVLQCEHIDAVHRADEIFSVPGIDAIFVGPNDLWASMRSPDGADPTKDEFERTLDKILAACRRNGVAAGLHCFSSEQVDLRREQGWQFLALGSDLSLMLGAAERELKALGLFGKAIANY